MAGVWAKGASKKIGEPLCIFSTVEASNFKFGTQIGFGTNLSKTTFMNKISGGYGLGKHTKNGTPYVFLQPLKLATSNLVHHLGLGLIDTQIGFGTSLPKTTFWTKIGGGLSQRKHPKKLTPPTCFCNR